MSFGQYVVTFKRNSRHRKSLDPRQKKFARNHPRAAFPVPEDPSDAGKASRLTAASAIFLIGNRLKDEASRRNLLQQQGLRGAMRVNAPSLRISAGRALIAKTQVDGTPSLSGGEIFSLGHLATSGQKQDLFSWKATRKTQTECAGSAKSPRWYWPLYGLQLFSRLLSSCCS